MKFWECRNQCPKTALETTQMQWDQKLGLAEKGKLKIILNLITLFWPLPTPLLPWTKSISHCSIQPIHSFSQKNIKNTCIAKTTAPHCKTATHTLARVQWLQLRHCTIVPLGYKHRTIYLQHCQLKQWPSSWCRRGMCGQRQLLFKMPWAPASIFCPAVVVRTHLQSGKVEWMVTSN